MSKNNIFKIIILLLSIFLTLKNCSVVVVNGGQVTLSGAVTNTQIDLMLSYTSNVKWIALIWGPDQVNTDVHLFILNQNNAAIPVLVKDCYINEQSYIVYDDVNNIQPSVTSFTGDISNGIKAAYNRDLNTKSNQDIRLYVNSVVQVCFISSNTAFKGNGFEKGNQKICSFLSLHIGADDYYQDRLLGNYAGTTLIGGGNLTFYVTQSTDGWNAQPWLFLSVIHKQQGLTPFISRWIGITYVNQSNSVDLAMISHQMFNYKLQMQTRDMYAQSSTSAKQDTKYVLNQGGNDIVKIYGAFDSAAYFVASYKRKFSTGDINRDTVLTSGNNTFCFIYGNAQAFTSLTQSAKNCVYFNLKTSYSSNFRVAKNTTTNSVIQYQKPNNTVIVIKKQQNYLQMALIPFVLLTIFLFN